jgi:hypothetical protein
MKRIERDDILISVQPDFFSPAEYVKLEAQSPICSERHILVVKMPKSIRDKYPRYHRTLLYFAIRHFNAGYCLYPVDAQYMITTVDTLYCEDQTTEEEFWAIQSK